MTKGAREQGIKRPALEAREPQGEGSLVNSLTRWGQDSQCSGNMHTLLLLLILERRNLAVRRKA
jgi:hypothetical protein